MIFTPFKKRQLLPNDLEWSPGPRWDKRRRRTTHADLKAPPPKRRSFFGFIFPCSKGVFCILFVALCIICIAVAVPVSLTRKRSKSSDVKHFFTFGDSYTTIGFNITGTWPSVNNPLGNPDFRGAYSTSTGGPSWVDYMTTKFNSSLILCWDFAWNSATVNRSVIPPGEVEVHTMQDQVEAYFLGYVGNEKNSTVKWTGEDSLFSFWIGINDIGNTYMDVNATGRTPEILDSYFEQVSELHKSGARKFLFFNVPPVNRSPKISQNPSDYQEKYMIFVDHYNNELLTYIDKWKGGHRDSAVYFYDTHAFFTKVLDDPKNYGFSSSVSSSTSGAKPDLWWGDYHPGWAFDLEMAADIKVNLPIDGFW